MEISVSDESERRTSAAHGGGFLLNRYNQVGTPCFEALAVMKSAQCPNHLAEMSRSKHSHVWPLSPVGTRSSTFAASFGKLLLNVFAIFSGAGFGGDQKRKEPPVDSFAVVPVIKGTRCCRPSGGRPYG